LPKSVLLNYRFHVRLGIRMVLLAFGLFKKYFRAIIRSQHAVRGRSAEVDALFRLRAIEFSGAFFQTESVTKCGSAYVDSQVDALFRIR